MKIVILTSITALLTSSIALADLGKIKRVECTRIDNVDDHYVLTPNVFKKDGQRFAILSGDTKKRITYEDGRIGYMNVSKTNYFYEVIQKAGSNVITLQNNTYQFQVNREVTMVTDDFVTGRLFTFAFQPGIGGYGRGGIPQGTRQDLIYDCDFIVK